MLAFVLSSRLAAAQTITLPTFVDRKQPLRPDGQRPGWVNRADCLARDVLTFYPVTLRDYDELVLQVWAGARGVDCSLSKNRDGSGSSQCWLLYSDTASSANTRVDIPAIDLVARGATTGSSRRAAVVHGKYPDACIDGASDKTTPLGLQFFYVDARGDVVGEPSTWKDAGYDVAPPSPPKSLSGSAGDTRLYVDWTPTTEHDVRGYRFYCDPSRTAIAGDAAILATAPPLDPLSDSRKAAEAGASSETAEAGASSETADAGASSETTDGGRSKSSCSDSTPLMKGIDPVYPDSLDAYICGSGNSGDHSGMIEHLKNYTDYVVAVAAVDEVGNVGKLSEPVCATPVEVTDFFELYRQAGGSAGGGMCSLSRPPGAMRRIPASLAGVALAAFARRLRRTNRREKLIPGSSGRG
jgi:hypothetical protein